MSVSPRLLPALIVLSVPMLCRAAGGLVLQDDFSNPASGWPDTQVAASGAVGISLYNGSGGYQLTPIADATYGVVDAPRQAASANVGIEAGIFLYAGVGRGAAGLVCRHQDADNFYAFMVSGGHEWAILKRQQGSTQTLASGALESPLDNIAEGRLQVECRGSTLSLSWNGIALGRVDDAGLTSGRSGLAVAGEASAGTSAVYDDFILLDLDAS